MKTWIQKALASTTAMGVGALMLGTVATTAKAEDAPIMTYGVDIVTDYVSRGVDQFKAKFDLDEADHGPLNVAPALQPYFTLFGGNGLSFGIWTSFAITNRGEDKEKGFAGFNKLDELDYTLAYDWSNKLGAFTAGIIAYNYMYDDKVGAATSPEYFLKWVMPYAKSVNPYFAYYFGSGQGSEYGELGISGGESITWSAVLGAVAAGPKHITAKVGKAFGDYAVAFSAAYRPTPELVGYDKEGKYTNFEGDQKDYPSTIAWLTFSYSGSVAAK